MPLAKRCTPAVSVFLSVLLLFGPLMLIHPAAVYGQSGAPEELGTDGDFGIVEIRIPVDDVTPFNGLPAWQAREFRGRVQWSVRSDLYWSGADGFVLIGVDDDKSSRAVAVVPMRDGDAFNKILPIPENDLDPERMEALLLLNEAVAPLALRRDGTKLFVSGLESEASGQRSDADVRVLFPGDALRSTDWPGVEITFHPLVDRGAVLAFRIFVDYLPPTDGDDN